MCHFLTRFTVCAISHLITKEHDDFEEVFPIAGELLEKGGKSLDATWERLKASKANADVDKEGLRIEMNGGFKKVDGDKKRYQKAIIEFVCDKSKTGLENLPNPEDPYEDAPAEKRDEEKKDDDKPAEDKTPSLTFVSYGQVDDLDVLRLNWLTQYACEESKQEQDAAKGQHWGFFTWFIIVYVY